MLSIHITCKECEGPCWFEEVEPYGPVVDLVCLYCGRRRYLKRHKVERFLELLDKKYGKTSGTARKLLFQG